MKKKISRDRYISGALIGFLFLGIAVLIALTDRAPLYPVPQDTPFTLEFLFNQWVQEVVDHTRPGPFAYRVLVPYLVYYLAEALALSLLSVDFCLKVLFLTLLQVSFFRYMRLFYGSRESLLGAFLLTAFLTSTFSNLIGPTTIETGDILNAIVFCLALSLTYQRRYGMLAFILLIGMLNRETPMLLLPLILIREWPAKLKLSGAVWIFLAVFVPYFGLRLLIESPVPAWWTLDSVVKNIPFLDPATTGKALVANFRLAFFLGPLIALGAYRFRAHPRFLCMTWIILPFFIVTHYVVGLILELRIWIPLLIVVIPAAVGSLSGLLVGTTEGAPIFKAQRDHNS